MQLTIDVVGVHWQAYLDRGSLAPIDEPTAATSYQIVWPHDMEPTYDEAFALAITLAVDFSRVIDFSMRRACVGTIIPFADDDNLLFWLDCMGD